MRNIVCRCEGVSCDHSQLCYIVAIYRRVISSQTQRRLLKTPKRQSKMRLASSQAPAKKVEASEGGTQFPAILKMSQLVIELTVLLTGPQGAQKVADKIKRGCGNQPQGRQRKQLMP